MPMTAREAALHALTAYRRRGARPDMVLSLEGPRDPRDMALAKKLVSGVLQNDLLLDHAVRSLGRDPAKLQPEVLDILRLSLYQIYFLTRVPARAAVSEGVELTKRTAPRAAGLVNALLRRAAETGTLPEIITDTPAEALSIRYSHPLWLTERLLDRFGEDTAQRILEADNTPAPITAQVNTLKTIVPELRDLLAREGVETELCPLLPDALYLTGTRAVDALESFQQGLFYVQDAAARLSVLAADPKPGMRVLDLCAAPGGKSFAAALAMGDRGEVRSYDIHEKKTRLIISGAERLGLASITAAPGDARTFDPALADFADLVIADVPCSGIGVIRKKPEIRHKDPADLTRLPEVQSAILENASRYVRPGGSLLYSTCTILEEENQAVAHAFLERHSEFALRPFTLPEPWGDRDGMVCLLPGDRGTDGFFICLMVRKK